MRYLLQLFGDWIFQAATVFTILALVLDSFGLAVFGRQVPLRPWMYVGIWVIGLLLAAYRRDRTLRGQAVQGDLVVNSTWFDQHFKPKLEQSGQQVVISAYNKVHERQAQGWSEVQDIDEKGSKRRVVIGDDPQRIHGIPMVRKSPTA